MHEEYPVDSVDDEIACTYVAKGTTSLVKVATYLLTNLHRMHSTLKFLEASPARGMLSMKKRWPGL
jgi:hypothetical protein